jgi:VRR-NUC domain
MKTEEAEQRDLIKYLENLKFKSDNFIKFTSIPNSTQAKNYQALTKNTLDGLRGGLPDLFIIVNKSAFFIEMKRKTGGVVSEKQKKWIEAINQTNIKAYVCEGFDEAKQIVDNYLINAL